MDTNEMQAKVRELGIAFESVRRGTRLTTIKRGNDLTQSERDALAALGWQIGTLAGCTWQAPDEWTPVTQSRDAQYVSWLRVLDGDQAALSVEALDELKVAGLISGDYHNPNITAKGRALLAG